MNDIIIHNKALTHTNTSDGCKVANIEEYEKQTVDDKEERLFYWVKYPILPSVNPDDK